MISTQLEMLLFQEYNKRLWDVFAVSIAIHRIDARKRQRREQMHVAATRTIVMCATGVVESNVGVATVGRMCTQRRQDTWQWVFLLDQELLSKEPER